METPTLPQTQTDIINEVKHIIENGFQSFVEGDLPAIERIYTEDAILVIGEDVLKGREALMAFYQGFFAAYTIKENYPITTNYLVVTEEAVTLNAHEKMVLTPNIDEVKPVDTELQVTFVFRKTNGEWLCCYEQASTFAPLL